MPDPAPPMRHLAPNEYDFRLNGRLVSVSKAAPNLAPLDFLRHAQGRERFFWHDGRTGETLAGMGVAVELMGWGEARVGAIERQARALFQHAELSHVDDPNAQPRLFGGFAFRDDFVPDEAWTGFNPGHFILPHLQLTRADATSRLTLSALVAADEALDDAVEQLDAALSIWLDELRAPVSRPDPDHDPASELRYPLDQASWTAMIDQALEQFATTPLEKVVLSRICEVRQAQRIAVTPALDRLLTRYPDCFVFLFEPRPYHAFFGATPELLAATHGPELESMALAGSIQRGATRAEDEALAAALLNSAKDRREHQLVVSALRKRLAPVTTALTAADAPTILRLNNIQHLYTPVQGVLQAPHGILPMVNLLHPTPALGGTPRNIALPFIRTVEPAPRGWYAAPVGWINAELDGTFAVAIRSAVAQQSRAWLYAGAGIVAGSIAEKEWDETGWKFRPMLEAIGVADIR